MEGKRTLKTCVYIVMVLALTLGFNASGVSLSFADEAADTKALVEKSKLTFDEFMASKDLSGFRDLLKKARGVFISPQMLEGAFIIGASGGSGVLLARDPKTGNWNGPAFYTIGEASFGLQVGGQASQVIMLALSEKGVNALLSPSVKLGADVGVALGPVGMGAEAATANISADIITYALSKGLYGGVSLEGALVAVRAGWNEAYYKKKGVTPTDILIRKEVKNPHASKLIETVSKGAGGADSPSAGTSAPKKPKN
jgi:lipid-binding SYLF domain-containing protein